MLMTKIYYMTGTGNSLKIAKDLSAQLGGAELVSMPHLKNSEADLIIEGDVVGFVFPVYFGRPPVFIQEFISSVVFKDVSYSFTIINGGGLFGRSLNIFRRLLSKKGLVLDAGFTISMPGTYPYIPKLHRRLPSKLLANAAVRIDEAAKVVQQRGNVGTGAFSGLLEGLYSLFAFDVPYYLSKNHRLDDHFWINDGCRNCGLCIEICPVNNIIQKKWKPGWKHECINCLACYHLCPYKGISIRHDWKLIDLIPYDILQFRYRNPEISVEELLEHKS